MIDYLGSQYGLRCASPGDIPTDKHYVIIEFGTIHIPADQRSIQHPGHGYPASTEITASYIAFSDKDHWEAAIKKRALAGDKFTALYASPAAIEKQIAVKVAY